MVIAKIGIIRHGFVGFVAVFVDVCDILIAAVIAGSRQRGGHLKGALPPVHKRQLRY